VGTKALKGRYWLVIIRCDKIDKVRHMEKRIYKYTTGLEKIINKINLIPTKGIA